MAKKADMVVMPFRLPPAMVKRLDQHAERIRKAQPGLRATRSDALRMLVNEALDRAEEAARNGKT